MYRDTITQDEGKLNIQTKYNIYRLYLYEHGHRINAPEARFSIELLEDHEMIPMEVRGYTYTFSNNINSDIFEITAYDGFWFDYALPGYFVSSLKLENGELIEGVYLVKMHTSLSSTNILHQNICMLKLVVIILMKYHFLIKL